MRQIGTLVVLLSLFGVALAPERARAHPHVWIDARADLLTGGDPAAITGLSVTWRFDEFYSAYSVEGYDEDGDGQPDAKHLESMIALATDALKDWLYYADARLGDDRLSWSGVSARSATWKDGVLSYHFTLDLAEPVPLDRVEDFSLRLYDPSYYISILMEERPDAVSLSPRPPGCVATLHEPEGIREVTIDDAIAMAEDVQPGQEGLGFAFSQVIGARCE